MTRKSPVKDHQVEIWPASSPYQGKFRLSSGAGLTERKALVVMPASIWAAAATIRPTAGRKTALRTGRRVVGVWVSVVSVIGVSCEVGGDSHERPDDPGRASGRMLQIRLACQY